jgi:hypothetical protein
MPLRVCTRALRGKSSWSRSHTHTPTELLMYSESYPFRVLSCLFFFFFLFLFPFPLQFNPSYRQDLRDLSRSLIKIHHPAPSMPILPPTPSSPTPTSSRPRLLINDAALLQSSARIGPVCAKGSLSMSYWGLFGGPNLLNA